jgi:uncharacterized lipoprotein YddW (UPF0748 family)
MRFIFLLTIIISLLSMNAGASGIERRAIWVVRDALQSDDGVDRILSTAVTANITDIFLQVHALGRSYYPSKTAPTVPVTSAYADPVAAMIEKAHRYNIRVHGWVNMFYGWSGNLAKADSSYFIGRNRESVLRSEDLPEYRELRNQGIEGYYLDPNDERVQKYLLSMISELVTNYPFDGIHLDYFRYPDVRYSFTPTSRSNALTEIFFDPLELYRNPEAYTARYGIDVYRTADQTYRRYLAQKLTDFLIRINDTLKNTNTKPELSVAVKPDAVLAKTRYFQDWVTWLDNGYCDFVAIMNYRVDWDEFSGLVDRAEQSSQKGRIIVGISTYNQNENAVQQRIELVRSRKFAGFSLFSFNHLIQNTIYLQKLQLFKFAGGNDGI